MRGDPRPAYPRRVSAEAISPPRGRRTRVQQWFRAHHGHVDAVLAGGLWLFLGLVLVVSAVGASGPPGAPLQSPWAVLVVASVQTLPLAWRRTRPDLSFGLVLAGHLAQLVVTDSPLPSNVAALLSAYAVARYSTRLTVRRVALAAAGLGGALGTQDWQGYGDTSLGAQIMNSIFLSGLVLVCWLGGDLTRKRHELVSRLQEQNDALRRDRDQRVRLAAQDERTRIAREMHDIVAHSLSVVVVQADGAAYSATHRTDFDRGDAARALTTIGGTAREALDETRRLVGVLRTAEDDDDVLRGEGPRARSSEGGVAGYAPTEGLSELPDLVGRIAASGVDVTLLAPQDLTSVPRETGLAAHRIVQESLTNVLKHAGPDVRVHVRVDIGDDLGIEVRDDGRGAAAADDGHGHGLIGMRERASSVGGRISAGPAPGGGYLVSATLPLRQESR